MYERMLRENCDYRQVESPNYEDHRESVWENLAHNMPGEQHSEHKRSMQAESRYPSSNHNHEGIADCFLNFDFMYMTLLICIVHICLF